MTFLRFLGRVGHPDSRKIYINWTDFFDIQTYYLVCSQFKNSIKKKLRLKILINEIGYFFAIAIFLKTRMYD